MNKEFLSKIRSEYQRENEHQNLLLNNSSESFKLNNESDEDSQDNKSFNYILIKDKENVRAKEVIVFFHGLNERSWLKYLPWALELHLLTGKAILMFPLAFHINRTPQSWFNLARLKAISEERKQNLPGLSNSTFANAVLSTRIHYQPHKFFQSGMQSYSDVINIIKQIRSGKHKFIYDDASIDLFGYSIGALLAQVLMMSNKNNYFDKSKLFIFCGGSSLDLTSPVAKAILDSEASSSLTDFLKKLFSSDSPLTKPLAKLKDLIEINFLEFLSDYNNNSELRDKKFDELKDRIFAMALIKDKVFPPDSVISTLNGDKMKVPVRTLISDFPYEYTHENPFPANEKLKEIVDVNFRNVFQFAASMVG